jgi:A/G-specific adenine glycosylase
LGRFYGIADPLNKKEDAEKIKELAARLAEKFPEGKRGALAQAFMELGATVCKPAEQAKCFECPIHKNCRAKEKGKVAQIPATKLRREMIKLSRLLLIYRDPEGDLILRQRPKGAVLGGQWEIPYLDLEPSNNWVQSVLAKSFEVKKPFSHTIMHRTYTVWPVELGKMASIPEGHRVLRGAFEGTLTTITRKFIG